MNSSIFFGKPEGIPEYRNPKFEAFIKQLGVVFNTTMICVATAAVMHMIGSILAYFILVVYHLVEKMRQSPIYFYDNKGLGPGWKVIFQEDLVTALRYALCSIGGGWLILTPLKLLELIANT